MAYQLLVAVLVVVAVNAAPQVPSPYVGGVISPARYPYSSPAIESPDTQFDPNPQYTFSYSVNDPETGDAKSHEETRNGDNVQGSYSVVESDGSRRVVEYSADAVSGFNAVVHREAGAAPPPPAPVKAYVAAPAPSVALQRTPSLAYQPAPAVALQRTPSLAYQPAPAVALQRTPSLAYQPAPAVAFQRSPAVAYQPAPAVAFQRSPAVAYQPAPAVAFQRSPAVAYQPAPAVALQRSPAVAFQSAPSLAIRRTPIVAYQPTPALAYKSAPAVAYQSVPEVTYESAPAVRYAVPAGQQPGNVQTSFTAPFANYAY